MFCSVLNVISDPWVLMLACLSLTELDISWRKITLIITLSAGLYKHLSYHISVQYASNWETGSRESYESFIHGLPSKTTLTTELFLSSSFRGTWNMLKSIKKSQPKKNVNRRRSVSFSSHCVFCFCWKVPVNCHSVMCLSCLRWK